MAEKRVTIRAAVEGGEKAKADLNAIGAAGDQAFSTVGRGANAAGKPLAEFTRTTTQAGNSTRQTGSQLQNFGYQIQDVAVQIGGGTSAARAFSQQLPQMLSGLGLWGVAAGTATAILLPFVAKLFEAREGAKSTEDALKSLSDTTSAYNDAIQNAARPASELTRTYGALADEMARLAQVQVEFAAASGNVEARGFGKSIADEFGGLSRTQKVMPDAGFFEMMGSSSSPVTAAQSVITEFERAIGRVSEEYKIGRTEALMFLHAVEDLGTAKGPVEQEAAIRSMIDALAMGAGSFEKAAEQFGGPEGIWGKLQEAHQSALTRMRDQDDLTADRLIANYAGVSGKLADLTQQRVDAERLIQEAMKDGNDTRAELLRDALSGLDQQIAKTRQLASETDAAYRQMASAYQEYARTRTEGNAWAQSPAGFEAQYVADRARGAGSADEELVRAVSAVAEQLGIAAKDLLAVMSFETGGKLRPDVMGPTTKWGQHFGLIQFGQPQGAKYNVNPSSTITDQVIAAGRYLQDAGVKAGDSLANIYAAVLAGDARKINASDLAAGGVVGNVSKAVGGDQFAPHIARAEGLLAAYGGLVKEVTEAERESANAAEKGIKARAEMLATIEQRVQAAGQEAAAIGKSVYAAARERAVLEMTNDLKAKGIELTEKVAGTEKTWGQVVNETADALARSAQEQAVQKARQQKATQGLREAAEAAKALRDDFANTFSSAFDGVIQGTKSVGDAFADLFGRIASDLANRGLNQIGGWLFDALLGGLGGGVNVSAWTPAMAGAPVSVHHSGGWAGIGGTVRSMGGWSGLRPNEVPAILERGEKVLSRDEVSRGGQQVAVVRLDLSPEVEGRIMSQTEGMVVQMGSTMNQSLPGQMQNYRRDPRVRPRS